MRLLVVNWQDRLNPWAGGAEVHLHEIFRRLGERGHRITLLVSGWPEGASEEEVDGMRVVRAGSRYTFPLHAWRAYRRLAGERFDLIVEDINKLPLFTPFWSTTPVVAIVPHLFGETAFRQESLPVAGVVWSAERLMPRAYERTRVEVISESTADDLVRRGFDRQRIHVSHPGVDHGTYRPSSDGRRYGEPTIAYVGRLRRYKGIDRVLRALARLRGRGLAIRFVVAGRGDDQKRLETMSKRFGLSGQVEFRGFVTEEEKVRILQRCWCSVYPSPKEGWGMTNVEAAACGTPSVASDAPGLRESVVDGVTGFLVPHDDGEAWADRLGRLCLDPGLREQLGRRARAHAERFTWDATADETETILQSSLQT